ncbi:MAG TPA: pyridoxal phosphate-dependent aminotransferase [Armatimonadota bacterium]|nr:pyridoxal phosphate-dependent aminotransferase [Armatimonadota bacterium]
MPEFAARVSRARTEGAFGVLEKAARLEAQGRSIVHLEIGQPDFPTPEHIVEAGCKALRDGYTRYGPAGGLPVLREAIAEHIGETRGIDVSPEEVVVTPGAKPIIFFSALALLDEGDEMVYADPGFPIYDSVAALAGATPVPVPIREENDFVLRAEDFLERVTPRTKLLLINTPHNPTGGVLSREDVEAIAQIAMERGITVLSDEVYSRILYEGEHVSFASIPGMKAHTILLDGFSKTYCMTGWRLGYAVTTREIAKVFELLQVNSNSCTASAVQMAGVAALRGPQDCVDRMVAEFDRRRRFIVEGVNNLPGWSCRMPRGAFYLFCNVKQLGMEVVELRDRLLDEAGVATMHGTDFGVFGEGYMRVSYATSIEQLEEGLRRIAEWCERL